jgi:serine/threonine-protein phosphatase PP1 catalytic subunit
MVGGGAGQVLDVDNMISRLIEAGYSGKVTKSPPLKIAEINAVCLAAREVFLSQPTLIELSPPVKIVGDVHGQVRGTMPHGWYLPHKHVKRAVLI